jgi:hypothetical protein
MTTEDEDYEYVDTNSMPVIPKYQVADIQESFNRDGTVKKIFKAPKTTYVHHVIHLDGKKFDFTGRRYLYPIYNRGDSQILLKTARQVEKCSHEDSLVTTRMGEVPIKELRPGDEIWALDSEGQIVTDEVVASESNGVKDCVKIVVDLYREVTVTFNHPLLTPDGWVQASELTLNQLIGCISFQPNQSIIWQRIKKIEAIRSQPTWGIQTSTQTYLSGGIWNHNTTYLANNLTINSVLHPYNKSLYVSPSHAQTRQFSSEKLKPAIERSPLIRRYLQNAKVSSQVFEKGFANGSFIFLRSAFRSADRSRGISARDLCLDEIQDLLSSDIPVIMECTSHFENSTVLMAGTPKTFDNPIEDYWQESSQNEWLVKCDKCNYWNFLDEENVAPTEKYLDIKNPILPGPICKKCDAHLHVDKGMWVQYDKSKIIQGYRIPQLMVPWIISTATQWRKLLWKRDNYPFGQLANEVIGLSYDNASKPIKREELVSICGDYNLIDIDKLTPGDLQQIRRTVLVAGVDWGEGNDGSERSPSGKIRSASYTVLTIGYYDTPKRFRYVFIKKYQGKEVEPDFVVNDIIRICELMNVATIGVDWGHGWGVNNTLVRKFGAKRVYIFQYVPKMAQTLKWDQVSLRFILQRNFWMSEHFYDMKNGHIHFPMWKEFEPYSRDVLAIYKEYNEYMREIKYDHKPSDPDDFFHSSLLCKLSADIYFGKRRAYTDPNQ